MPTCHARVQSACPRSHRTGRWPLDALLSIWRGEDIMRKEQSKAMSECFDLSQQIENGMTYFPGDPEPHIEPADTTPPWRVTQLHIGTHVGTHIDAASHFIPHGKTISQYPPERFLLPGIVVPVPVLNDDEPLGVNEFDQYLTARPARV